MKSPLRIVGITAEGKMVIAGVFAMHDTFGFLLADSLMAAKTRGYEISLPSFVADAIVAGWKKNRAIQKVKEALNDIGDFGAFKGIAEPLNWISNHPSRFITPK